MFSGYFQSYRYFDSDHASLIREEFRFISGVREMAERNLEDVKFERMKMELDWTDDQDPEHPNDGAVAIPDDFGKQPLLVRLQQASI